MRGIFGCVVVALLLTSAVGCSRSAPTPSSGEPPTPAAVPPSSEGKRPKFEYELVHTNALDGGTGSSVTKGGTRDVVSHAITIKGRAVTFKCEIAYVGHRDGKDVYKLTYTVEKAGGAESTMKDTAYDGTRTVLIEDQYGTLVLQPPSK